MGTDRLRFGDFTLDAAAGRLYEGGRELELRPKSLEVLTYLAHRAGRVVTKDELFASVWPHVVVTDDSLVQCVSEIRQALGDRDQRLVRTLPRRGYMFAAPTSGSAAAAASRPRARLGWIAAGIAVVLAAAGASWTWRTPPAPPPPLSIVVMPLASQSGDPQQEYVAEWLAEDITSDLSRIPSSFVIASSSAASYRGSVIDPKAVGRELGVRYLLTGTTRNVGERVRVTLNLIDAESGREMWTERFEADRREMAALPDRVTGTIARELHLGLMEADSRRSRARHAGDPTADDLALQAWALNERRTPESVAAARELLLRSVSMDPASVFAWSLLSDTYATDIVTRWMWLRSASREDWLAKTRAAAQKAYALDPDNLYALGAMGTALQLDARHEEAIALYEKQLASNRNYAPAWHRIAYSRLAMGNFDGALAASREALRLSPRDGRLYSTYAIMSAACVFSGRDDEALQWARKAIGSRPDFAASHALAASALAHGGRIEEARKEIREVRRLMPGYTIATLRAEKLSDDPVFLAGRERYFQGLRIAGLQE